MGSQPFVNNDVANNVAQTFVDIKNKYDFHPIRITNIRKGSNVEGAMAAANGSSMLFSKKYFRSTHMGNHHRDGLKYKENLIENKPKFEKSKTMWAEVENNSLYSGAERRKARKYRREMEEWMDADDEKVK